MDPRVFDELVKGMIDALLKLWKNLPPHVRKAVRPQWLALLALLQNLRAVGVAGAAAEYREIIAALKRLIDAFRAASAPIPRTLQGWMSILEGQAAAVSEGGAAAGGGVTVVGAVILIPLAIILVIMSLNEMYQRTKPAPLPEGGTACGDTNPIAKNLEAEDYSHFGERKAFQNALEEAKRAIAEFPCSGDCEKGTCKPNVAVVDIQYSYYVFWTNCVIKFDVWCECMN